MCSTFTDGNIYIHGSICIYIYIDACVYASTRMCTYVYTHSGQQSVGNGHLQGRVCNGVGYFCLCEPSEGSRERGREGKAVG